MHIISILSLYNYMRSLTQMWASPWNSEMLLVWWLVGWNSCFPLEFRLECWRCVGASVVGLCTAWRVPMNVLLEHKNSDASCRFIRHYAELKWHNYFNISRTSWARLNTQPELAYRCNLYWLVSILSTAVRLFFTCNPFAICWHY
jgi:hypothetical protein